MIRLMPGCARPLPSAAFHCSTRVCKDPNPYFQTLLKILDFKSHTFHLSTKSEVLNWRTLPMGEGWVKEMQPYQNALSQVIGNTIGQYSPELGSTIEIGSGKYPITEFLPDNPKKDEIHLSEFNVDCLRSLKKKYPNTVRQVNILSPHQTKHTYQTVIMSDVFNSFSENQIGNALRGVNKLLAPGGHLIHFSMREPIFIDALDHLKEEKANYLPVVDQHNLWQGVYVINRNALVDFICALKTDLMRDILFNYMSLSPYVQDIFCVENMGKSELQIFADLSKTIETFKRLVQEKILFENLYRLNLLRKLNDHHFAILEFREKEGNYAGPVMEERHWGPKANTFFAHQMVRLHSFDPGLPPGHVKERAIAHVLVAQKPS